MSRLLSFVAASSIYISFLCVHVCSSILAFLYILCIFLRFVTVHLPSFVCDASSSSSISSLQPQSFSLRQTALVITVRCSHWIYTAEIFFSLMIWFEDVSIRMWWDDFGICCGTCDLSREISNNFRLFSVYTFHRCSMQTMRAEAIVKAIVKYEHSNIASSVSTLWSAITHKLYTASV